MTWEHGPSNPDPTAYDEPQPEAQAASGTDVPAFGQRFTVTLPPGRNVVWVCGYCGTCYWNTTDWENCQHPTSPPPRKRQHFIVRNVWDDCEQPCPYPSAEHRDAPVGERRPVDSSDDVFVLPRDGMAHVHRAGGYEFFGYQNICPFCAPKPEQGEEIVLHRPVIPAGHAAHEVIPGLARWVQCLGSICKEKEPFPYEHAVATIRRKP